MLIVEWACRVLTVVLVVVSSEGFRMRMNRRIRVLPDSPAALILPKARTPYDCFDFLCSTDSDRYNVGCTKRVGLFHSDRSKLQKTGATTHNRRRASKASLPPLTKDTKKQVRGLAEPEAHRHKSPPTPLFTMTQDTPIPFPQPMSACSVRFPFLIIWQIKPSPRPFI